MEVFDQLVGADDLEHSTYRGMWQLNRCAPANLERCSIVEWNVERWAIISKWHPEEDRRRGALDHAGDDRRSRDPLRNRPPAEG